MAFVQGVSKVASQYASFCIAFATRPGETRDDQDGARAQWVRGTVLLWLCGRREKPAVGKWAWGPGALTLPLRPKEGERGVGLRARVLAPKPQASKQERD